MEKIWILGKLKNLDFWRKNEGKSKKKRWKKRTKMWFILELIFGTIWVDFEQKSEKNCKSSFRSGACDLNLSACLSIEVIIVAFWFEPVFSGTESSPTGHSLGKVGRFRCDIFNNRPFTWKRW